MQPDLDKVHASPSLQLVQVPLDGIPSFWHVNCTTQLGVICKLAEGALDLTMSLMKILNSTGPSMDPRDTTCHRRPSGHRAVDHYPLAATIQPIPCPLNSPPIKPVSPHFRV